jgi:DNA segregation ATPase FtsK/SpoIIIE-like protein
MAGSNQHSGASRARERTKLRLGQASKAIGDPKEKLLESTRMEQRADVRKQPTSSRGTTRMPAATKATSVKGKSSGAARAKSTSNTRKTNSSSTTKKTSTSKASRPTAPGSTHDTRFIQWVNDWWNALEPHHQQGLFSACLLILSLLLFGSLTVLQTAPIFSGINQFFLVFFGWSAYLLALGLVAFALTHLIEGIRRQRFVRLSLVVGLVCLWLLLLIESALMGATNVGVLGTLLVLPFLGWSRSVDHVVVLGLLLITSIITFRLTFGHVLLVVRFLKGLFSDLPLSTNKSGGIVGRGGRGAGSASIRRQPSPFLGQRPQYSRYSAVGLPNANNEADDEEDDSQGRGQPPSHQDDELDIEVELEDDDDPLNDINIHKQHVGLVPRGTRAGRGRGQVPPLQDPEEYQQAVRGVRQQPIPFEQAQNVGTERMPSLPPGKMILKSPAEMEPLAPNPRLLAQDIQPPPASHRPPASPAQAQTRSAKARAKKQEAVIPRAALAQQSLWKLPGTSLLNSPDTVKLQMYADDTGELAKVIQSTLRSFRVEAEVRPADISIGPTVIRFGIRPTGKPQMRKDEKTGKMEVVTDASGNIVYEARTRVSRIMALQNDLALVLEAKTIRMEAPVPGRPYVGVEIPNKNSRLVTLREVLESKEYQIAQAKSKLAIGLGKDVAGQVRVGDLAKMPHLLIAGATGSGKSICLNTIIASILIQATPDDVRLLMVDPKMVELNMYNGIPHLLSPVVIEVDKVVSLLKNAIHEMERRYRLFSQLGVRNLDAYRKMRQEKLAQKDNSLGNLPAIVIIIDELADLMMAAAEEVEGMICRLAQLARATGIHLIVATQRPSVDVITGLIKANIPTRISFMVSSAVDSRTIIDMGGAERLLGRGDMLYLPADVGRPERVQGAFLSDDEAYNLADHWRHQLSAFEVEPSGDFTQVETKPIIEPGWELKEDATDDPELEDDLLDKAEEVVREYGKASISLLQRRLRVGYSRAARLIDLLEDRGIIGHSEAGGRAREVYDNGNPDGSERGSHRDGGGGHSIADEVADIVAEEQARNDFLREQAARFQQQPKSGNTLHAGDDNDG